MPATVHRRAELGLRARTAIDPATTLNAVTLVASRSRTSAQDLLLSGGAALGARVHVRRTTARRLELLLARRGRAVELATFPAWVDADEGGTMLLVGRLVAYETGPSRLGGLVPVGSERIVGFATYRRFLHAVAAELLRRDAGAQVEIGALG